jgi:phosphatidylserine decarboxylase
MVRDGFFYGLALLVTAGLVWYATQLVALTAIPVLLAMFFLWFFRDPSRSIPTVPGAVVSPGDGVVKEAEWIETISGSRLRVTIFLSVFDVHVNRTPIAGTVTAVDYREGRFMNAMNPESAVVNEQTMIAITDGEHTVSFKQIAGLLARRIVCDLKVGDRVDRGARMGLIKFGSRVDVLMPADTELRVKIGQRVKGGTSIIGLLQTSGKS